MSTIKTTYRYKYNTEEILRQLDERFNKITDLYNRKSVAECLRFMRFEAGISYADWGRLLGVSKVAVKYWADGSVPCNGFYGVLIKDGYNYFLQHYYESKTNSAAK